METLTLWFQVLRAGLWLGRTFMRRDPYTRAIRLTRADFYDLRHWIPAAIHNWRHQDDVSIFLRSVESLSLRPDVPTSLVDVFVNVCSIPGLQRQKGQEIVETFVTHLQRERLKEDDSAFMLAQGQRAEFDRLSTKLSSPAAEPHVGGIPPRSDASTPVPAADGDKGQTSNDQLIDLAKDLINDGKPSSALASLLRTEKRIESENADSRVRHRLHRSKGQCYLQLNQFDNAVTAFRKAADYQRDSSTLQRLARALYYAGDEVEALKYAEEAVQLDDSSEDAWAIKVEMTGVEPPKHLSGTRQILVANGVRALRAGDGTSAVLYFQDALANGKRDPEILILLAEAKILASASL